MERADEVLARHATEGSCGLAEFQSGGQTCRV